MLSSGVKMHATESFVSLYLKVCYRIVSASLSGILNMFKEKIYILTKCVDGIRLDNPTGHYIISPFVSSLKLCLRFR